MGDDSLEVLGQSKGYGTKILISMSVNISIVNLSLALFRGPAIQLLIDWWLGIHLSSKNDSVFFVNSPSLFFRASQPSLFNAFPYSGANFLV